jgi:hypothetical protein
MTLVFKKLADVRTTAEIVDPDIPPWSEGKTQCA